MNIALLFATDKQRQQRATVKRNERIEIVPLAIDRFVGSQQHKDQHRADGIAPHVTKRGQNQKANAQEFECISQLIRALGKGCDGDKAE